MKNILLKIGLPGLFCMIHWFADAQNNPIFSGGTGDGHSKAITLQSGNNIFGGGNGDGHASLQSTATTADRIFKGGDGDGWNSRQTNRGVADTIFSGGNNDGWSSQQTARPNVDTLFNGGNNDGWSSIQTARPNVDAFFKGGDGDGWASTYRPQGPIPVNFIYFNASKYGESASLLSWKTSQEINSAYFDVERSEDAVNFQYIGRVNAAGYSTSPLEYSFTDNNPVNGINYYRLRQVDRDGHFIYTPTRQVRFERLDAGMVKYFPNPTSGKLYIEIPENMRLERKVINITNAAGVVMDQQKTGSWNTLRLEIDLGKYAKGVYFIQVKTATASSVQRVVLQ